MGEQPVFSTKSHVFQIDPATKKSWIPCSKQAVTVSFYYDPNKETHRIISVDGSKAIINSIILSNMTFTKTSQKFGQWSDQRANTVYGLGFASEAELNKFADKFLEAKNSARTQASSSGSSTPTSQVSTAAVTNSLTAALSNSQTVTINGIGESSSHTTVPEQKPVSTRSSSSTSSLEDEKRVDSPDIHRKPIGNLESQLKYENDRLKMALAQSSTNAKKWETELQTLKNNNARLTAALQESTANVEEWKKQLNAYKEESLRLRKKVQDHETAAQSSVATDALNLALQQEKITLESRVLNLETLVREKDEEILKQNSQINELANLRQSNALMTIQIQELRQENEELTKTNKELEAKSNSSTMSETQRQELGNLHNTLSDRISEISRLNESIKTIMHNSS